MQRRSPPRYSLHAAAMVAALALAAAWADTLAPDTSAWKCEQCPFLDGYDASLEAGALYTDGANFSFGRYTGIDRSTVYVDASASGQYRSADGVDARYELENLGLPSREGSVSVGQEGRYDLTVGYDGQPTRLFETGATPFLGGGSGNLTLPANWVASGGTAGMSALAASLTPLKLEYDRRTASLLASYFASSAWTFHAGFSHQEKDGTDFGSGSFLTQAMQLPQPIDYVTDSLEAGAAWSDRHASFRLIYTGSWFKDNTDSLTFANPYLPLVPGATEGRLALPPDNNLQQVAVAGNLSSSWWASSLTYAASYGTLRQDAAFLPYSTLAGATVPTPGSLDGDVRLLHYSLGLASHPVTTRLSARADLSYDGRDDRTTPLTLGYVLTDTFPGPNGMTPRYSEDRTRLEGSADYLLLRWLRVGIGGTYLDTYYPPSWGVISHTRDDESWGRATFGPLAGVTVTLKGGDASRTNSGFNPVALLPEENPLIYQFNYAPRDRVFYTLTGSWSATAQLTWSVEGFFADDDYRLSQLGLSSVHQRRGSSTLSWAPSESLSAYIDGGYQRLYMLQAGFTGALTVPWLVSNAERFWSLGAGGEWAMARRWTLALDYVHAPSYGDTGTQVLGLSQPFPENWSRLDSARLDLRYKWTPALQMHLRYIHEKYASSDWALDNVGPDTIANLLAFGVLPYSRNVNLVGLTVRYQFGVESPASTP